MDRFSGSKRSCQVAIFVTSNVSIVYHIYDVVSIVCRKAHYIGANEVK